jgi:molecular chaperone GrpE
MSDNDRLQDSGVPRAEPAAGAAESATVSEPPAREGAAGAEAAPAAALELQDPAVLLAGLSAERDELARQRDEYYELLLRRSAEFENYRRRVERERRELVEFAGMETVRELLPVLDDFERALKVESADRDYVRGVELIYQRLLETLKKLGLEPIACRGEKFDPHRHEAVEMTPSEEVEDHTVIEEYRRGYNFRGRLLRPAMVKVAVKP